MKTITTNKRTQEKVDRIERAACLIEAGMVIPMGEGKWRVLSDRQGIDYIVTTNSCECHDFTETLRSAESCKHIWAAVGATAAMLIHEIRAAEDLSQLEAIGHTYADAMQHVPQAFYQAARNEYRARHRRLDGIEI